MLLGDYVCTHRPALDMCRPAVSAEQLARLEAPLGVYDSRQSRLVVGGHSNGAAG